MTQVTEAIYSEGSLHPVATLDLDEKQRVRIIVQPITDSSDPDRDAALARLFKGIEGMNFRSEGAIPSRESLHDRI